MEGRAEWMWPGIGTSLNSREKSETLGERETERKIYTKHLLSIVYTFSYCGFPTGEKKPSTIFHFSPLVPHSIFTKEN